MGSSVDVLEKRISFCILRVTDRRFLGLPCSYVVTVRTEVYRIVPSTDTCPLFIHSAIQSGSLEYLKTRECSWNTLFSGKKGFVDVSTVTLRLRTGR